MHTVSETVATPGSTADGALVRVAVAGATGYTGQELLRLLSRHPHVSLVAATSSGATATRKLPALSRIFTGTIVPLDAGQLARDADLVFLALPDAAAAELAPKFADAGVRVIDLSGALRLRDESLRARWYPETHALPEGLAYGLTEHAREQVRSARVVANPGCYPTAALLALKPLVDAGVLKPGADIIVDAKSGVSGAGKTPTERTHFSEVHGNLSTYRVMNHRHGAEIEQGVGGPVTFTPHLLPIDRGILETIYVRVAPGTTEEALGDIYDAAYRNDTFVRTVGPDLPEIRHVAHTNFCDIGWRVDPSGLVIIVSVIDNLVKGAAGQAIQNMNVLIGARDTAGLL